ncbi:MAG: 2-deoxyribose-5-phosphate aldolase, partial [Mollicutes bacterium]|nr:2-deoxyribose-5-phosphate aldolase [Mollicutes bacterium]
TLQGACKIKASGGIHTKEEALAMVKAGATRIGCSASVKIMEEK